MKKFTVVLVLFLTFCVQANAQTFTAKTNRTEVPAGELFVLILSYDGPAVNDEPDLSPLDKNFTTYSVSSNSSSRVVNNAIITNEKWELSLISNATAGEIEIPAIKMGNLATNPLSIKISAAASSSALANPGGYEDLNNQRPKYAIRAKVDNNSPYVQQQIKYSVIVEDGGSSLQISEPQFADNIKNEWIIRTLRNPEVTIETTPEKRSYRKIVFNYAIFPQKSGVIKLPEARIDGYYVTQSKRRNIAGDIFSDIFKDEFGELENILNDVFAQKNPVILRTQPNSVEVKPNPHIQNLDWWLPAKSVKISSKWETPASEFKVGEAIGRTIQIEAVGAIDSQLPNIKLKEIEGVKQYPEKPVLLSSINYNDVTSVLEISNVYIPTKSGNITIPKIDIYWFNTLTNRLEKSTLPATLINVLPNENFKFEANASETVQKETPKMDNQSLLPDEILNTGNKINNYIIVFAAFIAGIIITYLLLKPRKTTKNADKTYKIDYKKNVISAAKQNDFKSLRNNLLNWAGEHFKDDKILNLNDINKHISSKEFARELEIISANLYSGEPLDWNSSRFIKTFEKIDYNKTIVNNNSAILPKLYK
ncbi:MAG: BatD family protein [Lactobacillaceae bacterium]|jgi:hypothetical protein|nr:BatD family protein [Lactobacillaceae bacterium]